MHEQIFEALVHEKKAEISWQDLLYDIIKSENMDPWDINVSKISQMYIETVKKLKEHDFRISGKVILAAAMLLKIKSHRFVEEDMLEIDRIINSGQEMSEDEFYDELGQEFHTPGQITDMEKHKLVPRTPKPRKRKVSIYDLMEALDQALEVRRRRVINQMPNEDDLFPAKRTSVDISVSINQVFNRIRKHYKVTTRQLRFSHMVPKEDREARIYTFVPLLHLTNMKKINIKQEEHLGDIDVKIITNQKEIEEELNLADAKLDAENQKEKDSN